MTILSCVAHIKPQPRAWLTLDYWRLANPRASFGTHGGWSNEDVDVVTKDNRTWRELDYLWLWLADGANVGTMFVSLAFVLLYLVLLFGKKITDSPTDELPVLNPVDICHRQQAGSILALGLSWGEAAAAM